MALGANPSPGKVQKDVEFHLLSHWTEQARVSKAPALWAKIFENLGVPLKIVETGCCGMCGVYGHEARYLDESLGIFDAVLKEEAGSEHGPRSSLSS